MRNWRICRRLKVRQRPMFAKTSRVSYRQRTPRNSPGCYNSLAMNPAQSAVERLGGTTFKDNPLTLLGPELKPGDKAPEFEVVDKTMQPVTLAKTGGGVRIFSVVPSLDTPVCDMQTKRFNEEIGKSGNV